MRRRLEISPYDAALIVCALRLLALVHAEGWIWLLKAAAIMMPVSALIG